MGHDWKELKIEGTTGWYRCARCGTRLHDADGTPPADWKAYGIGGCATIIDQKAEKVENLLHGLDADTPEIRKALSKKLDG